MCVWPENHCLTAIICLVSRLAGFARLAFPRALEARPQIPWNPKTIILYPWPSVSLDSHLFPVFRDAGVHWGFPKNSPLPSWHPRVQDACEFPEHSENPTKELGLGHSKLIAALSSHGWPCFQPHPLFSSNVWRWPWHIWLQFSLCLLAVSGLTVRHCRALSPIDSHVGLTHHYHRST